MQPGISGDIINYKRAAATSVGDVTIVIAWHTQNYCNRLEIIQK
jgi:hypothetical protein